MEWMLVAGKIGLLIMLIVFCIFTVDWYEWDSVIVYINRYINAVDGGNVFNSYIFDDISINSIVFVEFCRGYNRLYSRLVEWAISGVLMNKILE